MHSILLLTTSKSSITLTIQHLTLNIDQYREGAARFYISSGDISSLCVATHQICPNGSYSLSRVTPDRYVTCKEITVHAPARQEVNSKATLSLRQYHEA